MDHVETSLAHIIRLEQEAACSGFRDLPELGPNAFEWPDIESPEAAVIWAADPLIGGGQALPVAKGAAR